MTPTRYELPFSDPTPDLSPTAQRILDAAKRVLSRDGFRGLTFETIAKEAGENPALIRYHFGSKAGLLTALVDSVMYQEAVELIEQLTAVPAGEARRAQLRTLREGVELDDGITAPAKVTLVQQRGGTAAVEIGIHEGRNRIVRRMMAEVGFPVTDLVRTRVGPIHLGQQRPGVLRPIVGPEMRALYTAVGL